MKPCAVFLVVLITLPFTAPFRTCDCMDFTTRGNHEAAGRAPTVSSEVAVSDEDASVAPTVTGAGRLKRVLCLGAVGATRVTVVSTAPHQPLLITISSDPQPRPVTVLRIQTSQGPKTEARVRQHAVARVMVRKPVGLTSDTAVGDGACMVWFWTRGDQELQVETRYDNDTSEFVVITSFDGSYETNRFADIHAFKTHLVGLERRLEAQQWKNAGPPLLIPEGFPQRPLR